MKKSILLLCLCVLSVSVFAGRPEKKEKKRAQAKQEQFQQEPEPESPQEETGLLSSIFDYGELKSLAERDSVYLPLVERFAAGDTTLTLEDMSLLYYGFAYRPGYKGSMDAVASPVTQLMKEGKFRDAWEQGQAYLKDNPVSLTTLERMLAAGNQLSMSWEELTPYAKRMAKLLHVIRASGDGTSDEAAFTNISICGSLWACIRQNHRH